MGAARRLFVMAIASVGAAIIGFGAASANVAVVDPNRVVPGSCALTYKPIFEVARDVDFQGDYARLAVNVAVTRDPETGAVTGAEPTITAATDNLPDDVRARLVAAVQRAYLSAEAAECQGVVTARTSWILRFGDAPALAVPDQPTVINRASASARLRQRQGAVELVDPLTARPRLTRVPSSLGLSAECYPSELWRDFGPPPPIKLMRRGDRFRIQFFVQPDGRAQDVRVRNVVTDNEPTGELMAALEAYVRESRFYPPVTDECRTRNANGVMFVGRD